MIQRTAAAEQLETTNLNFTAEESVNKLIAF